MYFMRINKKSSLFIAVRLTCDETKRNINYKVGQFKLKNFTRFRFACPIAKGIARSYFECITHKIQENKEAYLPQATAINISINC